MHLVSAYNVLKYFSTSRLGSLCLANVYENILDSNLPSLHSHLVDLEISQRAVHAREAVKQNQCGCRKKKNTCGPGCQCQGCKNVGSLTDIERENVTDTESDSDSCGAECLETEIVMTSRNQTTWNFR